MMHDNEIERMWILRNPLNFTRYFFKENGGKRFIVGHHHKTVCDALDRVLKGEINKLIINIAPRYGKTELAVKNFIAMGLAINPASNFIHLSYSSDLAVDNSIAIKDIVNSEAYQRLFDLQLCEGVLELRQGSSTEATPRRNGTQSKEVEFTQPPPSDRLQVSELERLTEWMSKATHCPTDSQEPSSSMTR
mgnify:CR=1 FL=1